MRLDITSSSIRLEGNQPLWSAEHSREQVPGPLALAVDGAALVRDCVWRLGEMDGGMATPESVRAWRKGPAVIVESRGRLPFGAGIRLAHVYRYGNGLVRVTTDCAIPRGARLRERLGIGCLELVGAWRRVFPIEAGPDGSACLGPGVDVQPWPADSRELARWREEPPLALVFERQDGVQLEIGHGADLWRWENAMGIEPANPSYDLQPSDSGLRFDRYAATWQGEVEPAPRSYRFSWYMAWALPAAAAEPPPAAPAPLGPHGDLDPAATAELLAETPGGLLIDPGQTTWPAALCRHSLTGEPLPAPCLAARGVMNRLKRIVRQLAAMPQDEFPIHFRGLRPGVCHCAAHLGRSGRRKHWDIAPIIEFGSWARGCLGRERLIHFDPGPLPTPSLRNAFNSTTDDE